MLRTLVKTSRKLNVRDIAWAHVINELNLLDNSYVKVGFPEKGTLKPGGKKGSEHVPMNTMSEIIAVASWQEFGTKIIPERPFMRQAFDNNKVALNELKFKLYKRVVQGTIDARMALGLLGTWMVAATKREIRNGNFQELSEYTIAKKKSEKPLIDIAQMINSIQFEIVIRKF